MAERQQMSVEIVLDLTGAERQLKTFAAANNVLTVPVTSPVGAVSGVGGLVGDTGTGSVLGSGSEAAAIAAAQAQATGRAAGYGIGPDAGGGGIGSLLTRRTVLYAAMGLRELGRAGSGIQNSELMAGFSSSPEQAQLVRAEAIESASEGFFGSLVFGIPNAFGMKGSPAQVAQQARELAEARKVQDDVRKRMFDLDDAGGVRSAYGAGGRSMADDERAARSSTRHIDELTQHANELRAKLAERTPTRRAMEASGDYSGDAVMLGGDLVLSGDVRNTAQLDLNATEKQVKDAQEQARFDAARRAERTDDILFDTGTATDRALAIAGGRSSRDVARFDLRSGGFRRTVAAFRNFGPMGALLEGARTAAEQAAQEHTFQREDVQDIIGTDAQIAMSGLQGAGQDFQAELVGIQAQGQAGMEGAPTRLASERVRRVMQARTAAAVALHNRSTLQTFTQLGTQSAVLGAELGDDPLGAQIAGIQGQATLATNAVTAKDIFGDARRWMIQFNANQEVQLARRHDQRARSDTDRALQGAEERARFQIEGGPLEGIRTQLSGLLQDEELDVRRLDRSGPDWAATAQKRRGVAGLQIDALRNSFYRSFSYQEANPLGVAGMGDLSGIDGVFSDAKKQAESAGRGESKNGAAAGWSPEQVERALSALESLVRDGIAAVTG